MARILFVSVIYFALGSAKPDDDKLLPNDTVSDLLNVGLLNGDANTTLDVQNSQPDQSKKKKQDPNDLAPRNDEFVIPVVLENVTSESTESVETITEQEDKTQDVGNLEITAATTTTTTSTTTPTTTTSATTTSTTTTVATAAATTTTTTVTTTTTTTTTTTVTTTTAVINTTQTIQTATTKPPPLTTPLEENTTSSDPPETEGKLMDYAAMGGAGAGVLVIVILVVVIVLLVKRNQNSNARRETIGQEGRRKPKMVQV